MSKFTVGDKVWVIERDDAGNACDVCGHVFLAACMDIGIVYVPIEGMENVRDFLQTQLEDTIVYSNTDLLVYPLKDIFKTRQDAITKWESEK